MFYQKKLRLIEAWRYENWDSSPDWVKDALLNRKIKSKSSKDFYTSHFDVDTGYGLETLKPGHWLVKNLNGTLSVYSDKMFKSIYEEVK